MPRAAIVGVARQPETSQAGRHAAAAAGSCLTHWPPAVKIHIMNQIDKIRRRGIRAVLADGRLVAAIATTMLFFGGIIAYDRLPSIHPPIAVDIRILQPRLLLNDPLVVQLYLWYPTI